MGVEQINNEGKNRFIKIIFLIICIAVGYQVLIPPYIGIANNGDFERLMGGVGIQYSVDPWAAENYPHYFFNYITNNFVLTEPIDNGWFSVAQINMFLSKGLCSLLSKTGSFDIRYLGFVNMTFYLTALSLALYCIGKAKSKMAMYICGVAIFFVSTDGYFVQYMNSFYSEPVSLITTLFFYGLAWLLLIHNTCRFKAVLLGALVVAGAFSVVSKQQDILCTAPFLTLLIFVSMHIYEIPHKSKIRLGFILSVLFLGMSLSLSSLNGGAGTQTCANVMLMDVLPAAEDPARSLEILGFYGEQATEVQSAIGSHTFSPEGMAVYQKYSSHFTRKNELKVLLDDPAIIIRMFDVRGQSLGQDNLGNFMEETGVAPGAKAMAFRMWWNLKSVFFPANFCAYLCVIILAFVLALVQFRKGKYVYAVVLTMSIANLLRFITIILGDSSHDDIKHFFMVNAELNVLLFFLGLQIVLWICSLAKKLQTSRRMYR